MAARPLFVYISDVTPPADDWLVRSGAVGPVHSTAGGKSESTVFPLCGLGDFVFVAVVISLF